MAGPNLELFRFAVYVGFPILIMSYYGDPEWYNRWVYPLRDAYLQPEKADVRLSETPTELRDQLAELKAKRLQKREERGGRVAWPHEGESTARQSLSTLGGGFAAASASQPNQEPQQPPPTRLV